jgi:hypothetical protein
MRALLALSIAMPFALIVLSSTTAAPAGWKTATDKPGKCQVQVPSSWMPGEFGLGMQSPDNKSTLDISASAAKLTEAKQIAATTFSVQKTIEDTPNRYWMAYGDNSGRPGTRWYVAVPAGGGVCAIQLEFDTKLSDADAKAIVDSLKKH